MVKLSELCQAANPDMFYLISIGGSWEKASMGNFADMLPSESLKCWRTASLEGQLWARE